MVSDCCRRKEWVLQVSLLLCQEADYLGDEWKNQERVNGEDIRSRNHE